ncbi:MAG: HlyD family efflux transporter periplasmic adaptor subunit [Hyphomicrobiales bacterium]|nr:HlyD family efflux transporter periplasmic adaptor subunit [Hyphomicrobiales bacterium]MCA1998609.1 HlyD family efflux transporter periplasmic adaptor subunit [Hyphomicrobiales bacterium]
MIESLCAYAVLAWILPGCAPPKPVAVGYVEGEYVHLAPIEIARIESVAVRRGERVAEGQIVAGVERADAELAVRDAEARLRQAEAQLANLRLGKRSEEIAAIEATIAAAEAQARDARRTLDRRRDLSTRGFATQAELDQAQTAFEVATARIGELRAHLDVARLGARPDEIRAAENLVAQAAAALGTARWRLGQRAIAASAAGRIADILRHPGEVAGPTAPVLSLLPDGAVKLKIYLPERLLSRAAIGRALVVRCDGCPPGLGATISYVAPEPEFTPPVIYSLETRQKLVYLVEARPADSAAAHLQPGQIVDVVFEEAAR